MSNSLSPWEGLIWVQESLTQPKHIEQYIADCLGWDGLRCRKGADDQTRTLSETVAKWRLPITGQLKKTRGAHISPFGAISLKGEYDLNTALGRCVVLGDV